MIESRITVLSIASTGTRSIEQFLRTFGLITHRHHVTPSLPTFGQNPGKHLFVVSMRDPRDVYMSHYQRQASLSKLRTLWGWLANVKAHPHVVIHVDLPMTAAKAREIGSFLSVSSERIASTPIGRFGQSTYTRGAPTIPGWVWDLREQWGYT